MGCRPSWLTEESLEASQHETNEQIKARSASAEAKVRAAEKTVRSQAAHAHTQWKRRLDQG